MEFFAKRFDELNTKELYEIMRARARVFVVEQGIRYCDFDHVDYDSLHCFLCDGDEVKAYLRAFYTNEYEDAVKIGRVLTVEHGLGNGREIMEKSINAIKQKMRAKNIYLHSQKQVVDFYMKLGFTAVSDEFVEAGIPHIAMIYAID